MASSSQSDHAVMRRLVRDGLSTRPSAGKSIAGGSEYLAERDNYAPNNLEDDVVYSIRSIERVVENFGVLKENFHFYKDLVSELRGKLDEEKVQREEVQREVAALERTMKSERERALRAENHAKQSEGVIKDLEQQLASLQSQTGRLVKAISLLVSAEVDVRGDDPDGALRLVS